MTDTNSGDGSVQKECLFCKKIFTRPAKYSSKASFCSSACTNENRVSNMKAKVIGERECPSCKKIFQLFASNPNKKTCSEVCKADAARGIKKEGAWVTIVCSQCGLESTRPKPHLRSDSKHVFCNKTCKTSFYVSRKLDIHSVEVDGVVFAKSGRSSEHGIVERYMNRAVACIHFGLHKIDSFWHVHHRVNNS